MTTPSKGILWELHPGDGIPTNSDSLMCIPCSFLCDTPYTSFEDCLPSKLGVRIPIVIYFFRSQLTLCLLLIGTFGHGKVAFHPLD